MINGRKQQQWHKIKRKLTENSFHRPNSIKACVITLSLVSFFPWNFSCNVLRKNFKKLPTPYCDNQCIHHDVIHKRFCFLSARAVYTLVSVRYYYNEPVKQLHHNILIYFIFLFFFHAIHYVRSRRSITNCAEFVTFVRRRARMTFDKPFYFLFFPSAVSVSGNNEVFYFLFIPYRTTCNLDFHSTRAMSIYIHARARTPAMTLIHIYVYTRTCTTKKERQTSLHPRIWRDSIP